MQPADLLVIGGGINGAGIARDAAMRGLRTILVEQNDLASGTSSRSSRLIHGGLRYLEQGELGMVLEANRERRTLQRIAPHLVWPLRSSFRCIAETESRAGAWRPGCCSTICWHCSAMCGYTGCWASGACWRPSRCSATGDSWAAPATTTRSATMPRLVIATARSAMHHGALVANYMAVVGLERTAGRVVGAQLEDRLTGERGVVRASVVVNASGPWSDQVRRLEDAGAAPLLQPTKGVHVVVDRSRLDNRDAVAFTSPIDGRVMFVLPWGDLSYIGTTDTDSAELAG